MLAPRSELDWLAMTSDQAEILYQVIHENHRIITKRWSDGVFDGLCRSLCDIELAGGAYIRRVPSEGRERPSFLHREQLSP